MLPNASVPHCLLLSRSVHLEVRSMLWLTLHRRHQEGRRHWDRYVVSPVVVKCRLIDAKRATSRRRSFGIIAFYIATSCCSTWRSKHMLTGGMISNRYCSIALESAYTALRDPTRLKLYGLSWYDWVWHMVYGGDGIVYLWMQTQRTMIEAALRAMEYFAIDYGFCIKLYS